ncbi:hypothetical protein PSTG_15672 [Puccinia striiformis f. sp. tritici PST-78]|uniref:Uncharacterized protein n=1 Tax=Puccinia striiformis f. sp. tritici PST-78 TaxID=1165861 RepID=A0A0L0UVA4_9BASI|nr:hypothetical protein PSTG_15672 [Puccinia striiformis f. sp. tritici PST-78]
MTQIQGQKPRIHRIQLARRENKGEGETKWDCAKNHSYVAFVRILVSQDLRFACRSHPSVDVGDCEASSRREANATWVKFVSCYVDCDYTLLLLSSISAILATPTPSKQLWLDLNLPAHDDIAGFQSAGTLSNAPMETPIAIATGESTLIAHHLPVTGASKRQRVDHTKKSAGAKPLLQEESGTFYVRVIGNPFEDGAPKGADRFPLNNCMKKKAKTQWLNKYELKASVLTSTGQSFNVYDWSFVRRETQKHSSENGMDVVIVQSCKFHEFFSFVRRETQKHSSENGMDGLIVQSCKFHKFFDMLNMCKGPAD